MPNLKDDYNEDDWDRHALLLSKDVSEGKLIDVSNCPPDFQCVFNKFIQEEYILSIMEFQHRLFMQQETNDAITALLGIMGNADISDIASHAGDALTVDGIYYDQAACVMKARFDFNDIANRYGCVFRRSIGTISHANAVLQLDPNNAEAYYILGKDYYLNGNYDKAISNLYRAIQLDPKLMDAYDLLAWFLATCPQADLRDGKEAVTVAMQGYGLLDWKDPNLLETLAAANAEAGDFDNAVKWESQYLAEPNLSVEDRADAQSRLSLYQAKQPYHESK